MGISIHSFVLKFYQICRHVTLKLFRLLVKKSPKPRFISSKVPAFIRLRMRRLFLSFGRETRSKVFKFVDLKEMDEDLLGSVIRHSAHILDKRLRRRWVKSADVYNRQRLEDALMIWRERGFEVSDDIVWAELILQKFNEWNKRKKPIIPGEKRLISDNVFDAIRQRRSVRYFENKDVEQEKIMMILEAGRWAPCSGNRQSWKFVVKKRAKQSFTAKEELSFEKEEWKRGSVLIYVAIDERLYGEKEKFAAAMDAAAAIQNMLLMAHYLGLGGCWTYLADLVNQNRLRKKLDLEDYYYIYSAVLVGYPMGHPDEPGRKPLDKIVKLLK